MVRCCSDLHEWLALVADRGCLIIWAGRAVRWALFGGGLRSTDILSVRRKIWWPPVGKEMRYFLWCRGGRSLDVT